MVGKDVKLTLLIQEEKKIITHIQIDTHISASEH